jgi:plastocyanin
MSRRELLGGVLAGTMVATLAACVNDHSATVSPRGLSGTEPPPTPAEPAPAETDPGAHGVPAEPTAPNEPAEPSPESWTGPLVEVQAIDNTFRPKEIEIAPGTMVVWRNLGRNEHDVLSVETDWGVTTEEFARGAEFAHVFTEPGEFHYYCTVHGTTTIGMIGTVTVTEGAA